jgi:hypothetical protein
MNTVSHSEWANESLISDGMFSLKGSNILTSLIE